MEWETHGNWAILGFLVVAWFLREWLGRDKPQKLVTLKSGARITEKLAFWKDMRSVLFALIVSPAILSLVHLGERMLSRLL